MLINFSLPLMFPFCSTFSHLYCFAFLLPCCFVALSAIYSPNIHLFLTHLLTHQLIQPFTHPFIWPLSHSFTHQFTLSLTHPFTSLFIHPFTHPFTHVSVQLPIYSSIYSFIYSPTYSSTYSPTPFFPAPVSVSHCCPPIPVVIFNNRWSHLSPFLYQTPTSLSLCLFTIFMINPYSAEFLKMY